MASTTVSEREFAFLLYEVLDTASLLRRERYADHSREVFDATLETARQLAEDLLAPHLREGDEHEPQFDNGRTRLVPPTRGDRTFRANWCASRKKFFQKQPLVNI
ncbi:acyl-CoA dehydrogenase N-terminal domain-containing protein [Acidovorax carolinensis]|uniref:acyl-CoA dehydrogenase N-terminal domain-containing protein n=1 Tax=Acidovorax carolinensis TaxID=553814 RepID=UPI001F34D2DB|nr:acyl-CoA dehydrogenase N-terminal domain-containing protein [Acidovorax carolinensis]